MRHDARHGEDDDTAAEAASPRGDVAAVILAGGRSRRMGRPKPWLELGGVPLLVHVLRAVRPLVREIVVVAAAGQELPQLGDPGTPGVPAAPAVDRAAAAVPIRIARDRVPDLGPLPALALGLATVRAGHAFALACDAPFVRRAVLDLLVRESAGADAAIPIWDERPQPLVAIYRCRLASELAALAKAGERRLQAITALPGVRLVPSERVRALDPEGLSFRTLNTPADYAAARRRWSRRERNPMPVT